MSFFVTQRESLGEAARMTAHTAAIQAANTAASG
jgi:hypothetical protein